MPKKKTTSPIEESTGEVIAALDNPENLSIPEDTATTPPPEDTIAAPAPDTSLGETPMEGALYIEEEAPPQVEAEPPDALMIDSGGTDITDGEPDEGSPDADGPAPGLDTGVSAPEHKRARSTKAKTPENVPATENVIEQEDTGATTDEDGSGISALSPDTQQEPPAARTRRRRKKEAVPPVLTVDIRGEVETQREREDIAWHTIKTSHIARRILTGTLDAIEKTESHIPLAIVDFSGYRIVIPVKEMMLRFPDAEFRDSKDELQGQQLRLLDKMMRSEIDFIVKGVDEKSRSVMASRRDAMLKKRRTFYFTPGLDGRCHVFENRVVEARVVAVGVKSIRVEVFGVENVIKVSDLSWEWIGDAHDRFHVGERILVRVKEIKGDSPEELSIRTDVRSIYSPDGKENLDKCRIQGKYAGKVIDIRKGVVFIRLAIGVNAVAHSCFDYRMPGKKDDVSFVVTHLDEDRSVAVGIITRIIKQNL